MDKTGAPPFVLTELIHEPASIATLLIILGLSVALDLWWNVAAPRGRAMSRSGIRSPEGLTLGS